MAVLRRAVATAALAALGLSAACSDAAGRVTTWSGPPPETPPPAPEAGPAPSWVAAATVPSVSVFADPSSPQPDRRLANPTAEHYPLVFRVHEHRGDWVRVMLPVRPNGSSGWVRASEVAMSPTPYRVLVELGAHRITLYRGTEVLLQDLVAVGSQRYPTPTGDFYVDATVELASPGGAYGPFQMSVAGFSDVLTSFGGGKGQIALHGTNNPAALGGDVSHGCIRLRNASITLLARTVPVGTPVQVVA